MLKVVTRLFRHSVVYAAATVLNRAVSIIMLPLYTRYLTKSEYGVLELVLVTTSVIIYFLQLGMGSALFRNIIYKDNADSKLLTSTAHYFLIIFSFFCVLLLIAFSGPLSKVLLGTIEYQNLLRLAFAGDFFLVIATIPMARLRIDERSGLFALIAAAGFIIGIALNILFLIILKMGLAGAVWAMTLNAVAFALIYCAVVWKDLVFKFSLIELKDMLEYGIPLVPASILTLLINMADRYVIRYYMGLDSVAAYGAAARISTVVSLMVNAFQMAWPAVMFSIAKEEQGPQVFARLFNYFNALMLLFSLGMALFAHEILTLVATANYADAAPIVSLIVLSFVFMGIYYCASIGIQVEKKTHLLPIYIGIAAVMNLAICLLTIPHWGLWGAGAAKLVSLAFLGITSWLVSLKYYHIPFQFRKIVLIYATAISLYIIESFLQIDGWLIPFKFFLLLLFIAALFFYGIIEIAHLRKIFNSLMPSQRGRL